MDPADAVLVRIWPGNRNHGSDWRPGDEGGLSAEFSETMRIQEVHVVREARRGRFERGGWK